MKELRDPALQQRLYEETGLRALFSFDPAPHITLWQADPREEILCQGELPDRLFYLVRGEVKLSQTLANGKVVTLDLLRAPCFLGELELLCPRQTAVSAQAQQRCWLFALDLNRCREQLLRARTLAQAQAYPLANRLALFLLRAAREDRYLVRNVDACQFLGVSYRHLQQTMGDFVDRGLLQKLPRGYLIADRAALRVLAAEPAQDWEEPVD